MKNLTDTPSFTPDEVEVPEDGVDPRTAASIEGPFQALVNRTAHLLALFDSLNASNLTSGTVPLGRISGIAAGNLADGAVTPAKLADAAVEAAKIADGIITVVKLSSSAYATAATPSTLPYRDGSGRFQAADPSASADVATKGYVDSMSAASAGGLTDKGMARALANTNQNLTGLPTVDGVTLVPDDVILLINQSSGSQAGPWKVASGAWSRPANFDSSADAIPGSFWFISEGTTYGNTGWWLTTDAPITLETTALTIAQFSGPGAIVAGTALTRSGNTLNHGPVLTDAGGSAGSYNTPEITVDARGHITAIANGSARALKSATTVIDLAAATAPTVGQVLTATDGTHATWQTLPPTGLVGAILWSPQTPTAAGQTWVPCNGATYSRSTYAAMAAILGSYTDFAQVDNQTAGGFHDGIFANGVYLYAWSSIGGTIRRSTNGTSWSGVSPGGSFNGSSATRFAWDGTNFLLCCAAVGTTIWSAANGSSWTANASVTTNTVKDLASNGSGTTIAFCNSGEIRSSTSPSVWTSRTSGVSTSHFNCGTYGAAAGWVGITADKKVTISADGTTWSASTPAEWSAMDGTPGRLEYVAGKYVLLTNNAQIWTSSNGTTWTILTSVPRINSSGQNNITFMGVADGKLILGGCAQGSSAMNDYTWTSDLVTWTSVPLYDPTAGGSRTPVGVIRGTANELVLAHGAGQVRASTSGTLFYAPYWPVQQLIGLFPFIRIA